MSKYRLASLVAVLFVAFGFSQELEARTKRAGQIPNNEWGCGACHTQATGGGPRNAFGQQVGEHLSEPKMTADVNWQAIYDLDADGDGFTNGEELGDPEGNWEIGDENPEAEPTNPADADDHPSGGGGDTGMSDTGTADTGTADTGSGGEGDAASTADTGGLEEGDGAYDEGCSAVGGRPVGAAWLVMFVGALAWSRRRRVG